MEGLAGDGKCAAATTATGAQRVYRAYARRWVFLLVVSLLSCSNATVRAGGSSGREPLGAGRGPRPGPCAEPLPAPPVPWCAGALVCSGSNLRGPEGTVGPQGRGSPATTQVRRCLGPEPLFLAVAAWGEKGWCLLPGGAQVL